MNILDIKACKGKRKLSMVTSYDFWSAQIIESSNIDMVLVGDSLAMVMHGESTTIPADISVMKLHVQAVAKGCPSKFIVGDMPFLSYRKDLTTNMNNVESLLKAGAHAIKLEGVDGNQDIIRHTVQSGIPVMGHIGLTPQFVHQFGGFKVQGRNEKAEQTLIEQAKALEDYGCFSVVLECIPHTLAEKITHSINIPTIGIGAGAQTDGQVLVFQDLLGLQNQFKPKFVRHYMQGYELIQTALNQYHDDVTHCQFPSNEEAYQ